MQPDKNILKPNTDIQNSNDFTEKSPKNILKSDSDIEIRLKNKVRDIFDNLELVIGCRPGSLAGRVSPCFINEKRDIETLVFNSFCINNLSSYAYLKSEEYKDRGKIGIILKPCDVKSIVALISEGLLAKDKICAIVTGCNGIIDFKKIQKQTGGSRIISVNVNENSVEAVTVDETINLELSGLYADKCYSCNISDNPPYFDEFITNNEKLSITGRDNYAVVGEFENRDIAEVYAFWEKEFSRCIRCYACRNVCPLEVCRDRCIAQLDMPNWQSQKIDCAEGKFFQQIRVFHLAGRCTECGECERACPANIPIVTMMKKVNKDILRLFDFVPGMDTGAKPPLLTFKNVEKNIKEEELF
jgi:formate dehydrogenase subunit beta